MSEGQPIPVSPMEIVNFTKRLSRYIDIQPRTYWWEFPFYTIIKSARQQFCLGNRPEDLAHIATIEQKAWKKHLTHLDRLDHFPLDKAEYYLRLKESHGVNSIRGLAKITGEDWSGIARIIRTLGLIQSIKDFLRNNKNDPTILEYFHLRRLLEIVRQGDQRPQLIRFRAMMEELEEARG